MGARRLNGWQRVGIVASVLWAIGSWTWITRENVALHNDPTYDPAILINQVCLQQPNVALGACQRRLAEDLTEEAPLKAAQKAEDARDAIISALAPIPLVWLIAYALIGLVRWIRRRFITS